MRGTSSGQLGIFDGLYGFLQVIISQKKPGNAVDNPFLLCWHGESVAGSTDSLKPKPFGCPPIVGQGLTESAPPAPGKRAPAKQKKQREFPLFCSLGIRGMQQANYFLLRLRTMPRFL